MGCPMNDVALPLALPATQTFEDWSNLGRRLCSSARKLNWLIGDWLIDGSTRFGDGARDEANAIFRADVERFDPILKTCRRFPEDTRHQALTFGHHLAVLPVEDDQEAEAILAEAETNQLTVAAVKAKVRVRYAPPSFLPDDDPEDTAMRLIAQAWNRAPIAARESFIELANEADLGEIEL